MSIRRFRIPCAVLAAAVLTLPALAAPEDAPSLDVRRWLVLGPVAWPMPAFAGEAGAGFALKDVLDDPGLDPFEVRPAPHESTPLLGGREERWTVREAAAAGVVPLDPPREGDTPAVAWLAVHLGVERWVELRVELTGRHPRRVWIDGEPIARSDGSSADEPAPAPATGKVGLEPGKHLLLLATVLDPDLDEPWSAGARLTATGDIPVSEVVSLDLDAARDVTLADVTDAPAVESMALAPDGKRFAASVRRIVPGTDASESWIEIRSTDTGKLLDTWRGSSRASQVSWSPDGRWLSWIGTALPVANGKEKGDAASKGEASAIWLRDERTAETRALTGAVERLTGYRWTPAGDALVYQAVTKAEPDERGVKRVRSIMDRWATFRDKEHLYLVTVPGGVERRLTAGAWNVAAQDVSRAGRVLASRQVEDVSARPYSRNELWSIDLATVEARKLRDVRWLDAARFSPDGSRLALVAEPAEFGDAGVTLTEGVIPNSYDGELFLWEPGSDAVRAVSRDLDASISGVEWSRHDGKIYVTAVDGPRTRLYRLDPRSGTPRFEPLETGMDWVDAFVLAESAPVALVRGSSPWEPESLVAVDLASGKRRRLEHPADLWFAPVRRGTVETFDHTSSTGRVIPGHVYLPPDFDPKKKYPCIVNYYGGTTPTRREFGGRYPKEWWAANGYVVYVPQPAGAIGWGQEASALHVNDWGATTAREVIEGTRAFLAAHPYVDPGRVGAIGASYGGFLTMTLVIETDLFAAAVAHAGISSLASYWGEGYWGYSYSAVATAESFPWNRPDLYVERSPLFRADEVETPILLTHGRSDTNVPVGESDQFFVALRLLGAPVEYVQVEGEDHWILTHDKRHVWSKTILAWFDRWLEDEPGWWNALYPD
jgi:dipeptidyl aminopeptidase/acylaminoacyl peptidase